MTKKQRTLVTIIIPTIILIIIIAIAIGILYIKTDFLKSNDVLFAKYAIQNVETLENIFNMNTENDYSNLLKQNNYEYNAKASAEYLANSEKTDDILNDINLNIEGKVNNTDNINFSNIKINDKDEEIIALQYINQNNNMYSLKFLNIFEQYISIENNNLKELSEKIGMNSSSVPDQIQENINIEELLSFTEEEINNLKTTYSNLILGKIQKNKFTKQRNSIITVNEKSMKTNAYILKLTREELNNIYISILETLKEDQIILNKIDKIESTIYENVSEESTLNIKEQFLKNIDEKIKNIQDNNIGQDEIKFTVYENKGITLRTLIETETEKTIIDIKNEEENKGINIQTTIFQEEENTRTINISQNDSSNNYNFIIKISKTENGDTNNLELSRKIIIENSNVDTDTTISYNDENNQITLNFTKNNNILQNTPEIENISEENNVVLNNYSQEQLSQIFNTITQQVQKSLDEKTASIQTRFNNSILNINARNDDFTIEDTNEMSEVQKNRFNSKFEFYESEETTYENVEKLLEVVSENLGSMEVISGKELKLNIEKGKEDQETINNILNVISKNKKYKIEMQYNENNVIESITLTILSK